MVKHSDNWSLEMVEFNPSDPWTVAQYLSLCSPSELQVVVSSAIEENNRRVASGKEVIDFWTSPFYANLRT